MSDEARTLKVRCATWDQVEAFYATKLKGNVLVVKMPVKPVIGDDVTVALALPNGLVFAIDGKVTKLGAEAQGKWPVAVRLDGLTPLVQERLAKLVADGREGSQAGIVIPPPSGAAEAVPVPAPAAAEPPEPEDEALGAPQDDDVVHDEDREVFAKLDGERGRLLEMPAHEVLGAGAEPTLGEVRAGYLALSRRYHPDLWARYRSPGVRRLAFETFLHVNQAYDRMRAALGDGEDRERAGWVAEIEDLEDAARLGLATGPQPALGPARAGNGAGATPAGGDAAAPEKVVELEAEEPPDLASPAVTPAAASPAKPASTAPGTIPPRGGSNPPEEPDDVPFDTARGKALTAEVLFADSVPPFDTEKQPGASGTKPPVGPPPSPSPALGPEQIAEAIATARDALGAGRWSEAREKFAAALRADPRNRPIRALYHVASGMELREKGEGAKAHLQFETALAHDRECEEAKRAMGQGGQGEARKGLFRRFFDR